MRRLLGVMACVPVVGLAGACTTVVQQPGAVAAVAPQLSVERFLQAANDRDIDSMSRLFGTPDGPIGDTGSTFGCFFKKIGSWFGGEACESRKKVEIRLDAIARLLHYEDYKITHEEQVAGRSSPSTRVFVDMTIGGEQVKDVPFVVVRSHRDRWLVAQVGLEQLMAKEE